MTRSSIVWRLTGTVLVLFVISGCRSKGEKTTPSPSGEGDHAGTGEDRGSRPQGARSDRVGEVPSIARDGRASSPERDPRTAGARVPRLTETPRPVEPVFSLKLIYALDPFAGGEIKALAVGSATLALAGPKKKILVFDSKTRQMVFKTRSPGTEVDQLAFSGDGTALMATDTSLTNYIWRKEENKLKFFRKWYRKTGKAQALSRNGEMLVREDVRSSVRWYELRTHKMKELIKASGVVVSGDGKRVVVRAKNGALEVRSTLDGGRVATLKGISTEAMLGLSARGDRILVVLKGEAGWIAEIRDVSTGSSLFKVGPVTGKPSVVVVSGSSDLAGVAQENKLVILNLATGKVLYQLKKSVKYFGLYQNRLFLVPRDQNDKVECYELAGAGAGPSRSGTE